MSAKDGAMIALKPYCCSAHGACSRDEPQPKFLRARRIDAPWYIGWVSTKSGVGLRFEASMPGSPMSRKRQASNTCGPKPVRLMDFRNCFGMIASVSTFSRSSGSTAPVWTVNFSIAQFYQPGDELSRSPIPRRLQLEELFVAPAAGEELFVCADRLELAFAED